MACKYDLLQNPSKAPTGSKYYHARPLNNGKADLEGLCRELAHGNNMTKTQIKAQIVDFIDTIKAHLCEGQSVNIDGFGTFQVTLACPPGTRHPENVRAGSISVKSVAYKPNKSMVKELRDQTVFERTHTQKSPIKDCEALLPVVEEYFKNPETKNMAITSRYLSRTLGITVQKASDYLHELVEKKYLRNPSPDVHHPMYLQGERLQNKEKE